VVAADGFQNTDIESIEGTTFVISGDAGATNGLTEMIFELADVPARLVATTLTE
jgi:hypothetical protein